MGGGSSSSRLPCGLPAGETPSSCSRDGPFTGLSVNGSTSYPNGMSYLGDSRRSSGMAAEQGGRRVPGGRSAGLGSLAAQGSRSLSHLPAAL